MPGGGRGAVLSPGDPAPCAPTTHGRLLPVPARAGPHPPRRRHPGAVRLASAPRACVLSRPAPRGGGGPSGSRQKPDTSHGRRREPSGGLGPISLPSVPTGEGNWARGCRPSRPRRHVQAAPSAVPLPVSRGSRADQHGGEGQGVPREGPLPSHAGSEVAAVVVLSGRGCVGPAWLPPARDMGAAAPGQPQHVPESCPCPPNIWAGTPSPAAPSTACPRLRGPLSPWPGSESPCGVDAVQVAAAHSHG